MIPPCAAMVLGYIYVYDLQYKICPALIENSRASVVRSLRRSVSHSTSNLKTNLKRNHIYPRVVREGPFKKQQQTTTARNQKRRRRKRKNVQIIAGTGPGVVQSHPTGEGTTSLRAGAYCL